MSNVNEVRAVSPQSPAVISRSPTEPQITLPADTSGEAAVVASMGRTSPAPLTYSANGTSNDDERFAQLQRLVASMLQEQGLSSQIAVGDGQTQEIGELSAEDATKLVSDDGFWGVENTATRIADFALEMAGSDPDRQAQVREGLEKGFGEARGALGGILPQVSEDTITKTFEKFDEGTKKLAVA